MERQALKKGKAVNFDPGVEPEESVEIRYRTNDSSYEAIGELLIDNPTGLLVERDELVSLLHHLDREEQIVARGARRRTCSRAAPPGAGAPRMRLHRERRRHGLRCLMIALREAEIDVLIGKGLLSSETRHDLHVVREALYAHLDQTLGSAP